MSDLTERLRKSDGFRVRRPSATFDAVAIVADTDLMIEAADRIDELVAALHRARLCISKHQGGCANGCFDRTGRALEGEEPPAQGISPGLIPSTSKVEGL